MFFEREKEIAKLNEHYTTPSSKMVFLFGRRGVGKTTLLNHYIKNRRTLYFSFSEMLPKLYFDNSVDSIKRFFNGKIDPSINITNLESFFILLEKQRINQKIVIVFDDFQNLMKTDKQALVLLQHYWVKSLCKKSIQFIISTSIHSSSIEDLKIYDQNMSLFLSSLSISTVKKVIPDISATDVMYVYASFGTNLNYLKNYDVKKDFILNVKETFLNANSWIFEEGLTIVRQDISDVTTYASILHAISLGYNKIGDIASVLDIKASSLTRYIQRLVDMMIIRKKLPINEKQANSKFGRYFIEDNFLRFWFCYIYPNMTLLRKNDLYSVISYIRRDFSSRLVDDAYKSYVLELLSNEPEKFFGYKPNKIDSWWNNKECEIDIIGFNDTEMTFVDCRWRKKESLDYSYTLLKEKSTYVNTTLNKHYVIFAKNYVFNS